MSLNNLFNIAADDSFLDILARRFLNDYTEQPEKLSEILFLLPTRRACTELAEAFVRQSNLHPTILPRMVPIADIDEDEIFLSDRESYELVKELNPPISQTERLLILTKMIMRKPNDFGLTELSLAQAYALAQNLSALIDAAHYYELSFAQLKNLVPEEFAAHWQETLKLLTIITRSWPDILQEKGLTDTAAHRLNLLQAKLNEWQQNPPAYKIVVAGTTAAFPIIKKLVKTVLDLPSGEVYLYGLDFALEEEAWGRIDENHPQFELKELLDFLQLSRKDVTPLSEKLFSPREKFVSECMRPAQTSAAWRNLPDQKIADEAFQNIRFVNCDDLRQEAQAIALIIRETLETPEKTVALIATDRNLSRRVVSELRRWDIIADDSAGQPLGLTPIGIYLRLIINVLSENYSQNSLLNLMKHPFTACAKSYAEFNLLTRRLELAWRKDQEPDETLQSLLSYIKNEFAELQNLYENPRINIKDFFSAHMRLAETLAQTDIKSGDKIIWKNDSGSCAADFVSDFLSTCTILDSIPTNDYQSFFDRLLMEKNVRIRYGMHPRVKILGPIEARLLQFDVTIIGEVNEGSWPQLPQADMWMSRPMKKDFGLPLPEKNIGIAAADFAHLLNGKHVFLTRAERIDGTPTSKSRWWLRMETVLSALSADNLQKTADLYDQKYSRWVRHWERSALPLQTISAPHPCPPISMRPRQLSASNIENLMRDPYIIFAKYILHLYPLNAIDRPQDNRDFGNIFHQLIEEFNNQYPHDYPPNAEQILLQMSENALTKSAVSEDIAAFWRPKLAKMIHWIVQTEQNYRRDILMVHNEISGQMKFSAPNGDFYVTAKADRIDETKTGTFNILDYKTGRVRTISEIVSGMAPQLSIEGLIAESGGFTNLPAKSVNTLRYWRPGDKEIVADSAQSRKAMDRVEDYIRRLITLFDFPTTPYLAKPNPATAPEYSDYDHLSRYLEWAVRDNDHDE
ncbi:MAG: PD-(D/E)XK nuclease family protein [Alphaproteobacteria bacterium]|nr:PD-(D/E)XK nuclease family protein [Alphaproteobacteria bacterium]